MLCLSKKDSPFYLSKKDTAHTSSRLWGFIALLDLYVTLPTNQIFI